MKTRYIFVEGIADKVFIKQYLKYLKIVFPENNIVIVGGNAKLHTFYDKIEEAKDNNERIVVIFDADIDNDFAKSYSEITKNLPDDLDYKIFLFPNNHDIGNLETLLENIIPNQTPNNEVMKCFDKFGDCITEIKYRPLTIPPQKSKIFTYLDVLIPNKQKYVKEKNGATTKIVKDFRKEEDRDYTNSFHWDLNSMYLNNLMKFIKENF